ncbi:hypothetical protein LKK83_13595 [Phormidium sp. CCY1219]|nr:hypothetical protein [Phormidium sp. CCY1219]
MGIKVGDARGNASTGIGMGDHNAARVRGENPSGFARRGRSPALLTSAIFTRFSGTSTAPEQQSLKSVVNL